MSPLPPHLAMLPLLDHDGDTMGQSLQSPTSDVVTNNSPEHQQHE